MPDRDSPVVAKLRAAGAVLLGKANLSEFANFITNGGMPSGYSSLGGQVLNPYNADITPSGSSSGLRRGRRGRAGARSRSAPRRRARSRQPGRRRRASSACGPRSASCQPDRHPADLGHAGHGRPDDPDRRRRGRRARRDRRQGSGGPGDRDGAGHGAELPRRASRRRRCRASGSASSTTTTRSTWRRSRRSRRSARPRSSPDAERRRLDLDPVPGVQARPQRVPRAAARERADEDARGHRSPTTTRTPTDALKYGQGTFIAGQATDLTIRRSSPPT